jgi:hypothetical protein
VILVRVMSSSYLTLSSDGEEGSRNDGYEAVFIRRWRAAFSSSGISIFYKGNQDQQSPPERVQRRPATHLQPPVVVSDHLAAPSRHRRSLSVAVAERLEGEAIFGDSCHSMSDKQGIGVGHRALFARLVRSASAPFASVLNVPCIAPQPIRESRPHLQVSLVTVTALIFQVTPARGSERSAFGPFRRSGCTARC